MHCSYVDDDGVRWVKQIIPGVERIPTRVHIPYKISVAKDSPIIPGLGSSSDEYSDEDVRMENNGVVKGTKPGHVPPKYAKNSPNIAAGRGKNESTCKKESPKGRKSNTSCNKVEKITKPSNSGNGKGNRDPRDGNRSGLSNNRNHSRRGYDDSNCHNVNNFSRENDRNFDRNSFGNPTNDSHHGNPHDRWSME